MSGPSKATALGGDLGGEILQLLVKEIMRRLREEPKELKAADFEMIRKLLSDNTVTFSSIKKGEFGEMAKAVAEDFPFPSNEDGPRFTA